MQVIATCPECGQVSHQETKQIGSLAKVGDIRTRNHAETLHLACGHLAELVVVSLVTLHKPGTLTDSAWKLVGGRS
jgi:hypothetical protein